MGLVNAAGSSERSIIDILSADRGDKEKESLKDTFSQLLQDKKADYIQRIKNGDTEKSYQIGAGSYTETEWKKLLKGYDDAEEQLRQAAEEAQEEVQETSGVVISVEEDEARKHSEAELSAIWNKERTELLNGILCH